jgi:hypothetical protein
LPFAKRCDDVARCRNQRDDRLDDGNNLDSHDFILKAKVRSSREWIF